MIDLLPKLRSKGSEKGFYFNEKELKTERTRENLELQEFKKLLKLVQNHNQTLKEF